MHSRLSVLADEGGDATPLGDFGASETLQVSGEEIADFALAEKQVAEVSDGFGEGRRLTLIGEAAGLRKEVSATAYGAFPNAVVFAVSYTNTGDQPLEILSRNSDGTVPQAPGSVPPVHVDLRVV